MDWVCFIARTLAVFTTFSINYALQLSAVFSNLALASLNLFLILAGGIVSGVISGIMMKKILAEKTNQLQSD